MTAFPKEVTASAMTVRVLPGTAAPASATLIENQAVQKLDSARLGSSVAKNNIPEQDQATSGYILYIFFCCFFFPL